jgi:Leucine-rich repeat (LRR) protein
VFHGQPCFIRQTCVSYCADQVATTSTKSLWLAGAEGAHTTLTRLPDTFFASSLSGLVHLGLEFNALTELPSSIWGLQFLQVLALHGNYLEHLPASVLQLKELRRLTLDGNRFAALPEELFALPQLFDLHIINNSALQSLPAAFSSSPALTSFLADQCPNLSLPDILVHLLNVSTSNRLV